MSSNSQPLATANKAIHNIKIAEGGGGVQNHWEHHIILTKYEAEIEQIKIKGKKMYEAEIEEKIKSTIL